MKVFQWAVFPVPLVMATAGFNLDHAAGGNCIND